MNLNRRGFLASLAAAVTGSVALSVDPDKLLWVPGEKVISIPKPSEIHRVLDYRKQWDILHQDWAHSISITENRDDPFGASGKSINDVAARVIEERPYLRSLLSPLVTDGLQNDGYETKIHIDLKPRLLDAKGEIVWRQEWEG